MKTKKAKHSNGSEGSESEIRDKSLHNTEKLDQNENLEQDEKNEKDEKIVEEEQKEEAENKKDFAGWSEHAAVRAVANSRRTWMFAAFAVVVFVVLLMFTSGKKTNASVASATEFDSGSADLMLHQNEKKLASMKIGGVSEVASVSDENAFLNGVPSTENTENKQMMARENAPTQMYVFSSSSGTNGLASSNFNTANTEANTAGAGLAGQGAFVSFANGQAAQPSVVTATKMQHPNDTVGEGEFISATLETAINSDLPGMVRAVTSAPVYSYDGETLLLPAGSRLIGQYTSLAANGAASERVFVIWDRIITPNGISIMINSPGSDQLGQGGMGADAKDAHFWQMFGTASLLSVMGATTATAGVSTTQQPNSADMYRQSIASAMQQSAQNALNQNLNIQPTLHVYQGDAVTVFVAHDVDLFSVMAH